MARPKKTELLKEKLSITVAPELIGWVENNKGKPPLYFTSFSHAVDIALKELRAKHEK